MLNLRFVDEHRQCASCGCMFVFGAGEQELFYLGGLTRKPTRCPRCVRGGSPGSSPSC
jgi:ribosomal protein S27AE